MRAPDAWRQPPREPWSARLGARIRRAWGALRSPLGWARRPGWDLSSLITAADPGAPGPERRLWLIRLAEWLRSPPRRRDPGPEAEGETAGTPWPVRRLRLLAQVLENHPDHARTVRALLHSVLRETDATALLADFGFAPRAAFGSELAERVRLAVLPGTPDTDHLGELFQLVFQGEDDASWLAAIDAATLARLGRLLGDDEFSAGWRDALVDAIQLLASQVRAVGLSAALRQRMDRDALRDRPFHRLAEAAARLSEAAHAHAPAGQLERETVALRALLGECRAAAASVRGHLEAWGISVDLVFQVEQLRERTERIEALLDCLGAAAPLGAAHQLMVLLCERSQQRRGLRALFAHHYSMLARKVTERSAETGEHYITRTRAEWRDMLQRALGGGAIIAGTTLIKFGVAALGFSAFWGGFWAGVNYAASFVAVQLMHWTVATKQPAMTAPAMAAKLDGAVLDEAAIEGFVDEVAHLMRSQIAGIVGNLLAVMPLVLAAQGLAWWLAGAPLIGEHEARYVLKNLTLLGPTVAYAAFTGVLLFGSSLIAGWVENWFVFHRLDSAIAWNPRFVRVLGPGRAQRWSRWWRANISGLAANVSLGLMLGLVPALAAFFALPLEVRHVTLSSGQIAAALGSLGPAVLREGAFWWCMAAIPLTGALNVGVSFWLAFKVALRSRRLRLQERGRLYAALRQRLRQAPGSFVRPPRA